MNTKICKEQEKFTQSNASDYRGFQNKTISGRTCQNWTSQTPHKHTAMNVVPNNGVGDHNYCRNVSNSNTGLWCYTTDPNLSSEQCNPMSCD